MSQEPTVEGWRDLFQAAQGFYELGPWEWMTDSDMFGIEDPVTKEVAYLSVLGYGGELFGLVAYVGSEGFNGYVQMQIRGPEGLDWDLVAGQRCLTAFFEGREDLTARDRAVIRNLALRFRGPHAWPVFRSHRPGYEPWYVTADEARLLALALVQAQQVGRRLADDPQLLARAAEGRYLVRVPLDKQGKRWKDAWQPPPPPPPLPTAEPVPEDVLSKLTERPRHGVWEADVFLVPALIQEKKDSPPYYVAGLLCVHQESHFILGTDLVPYGDRFKKLLYQFATVLERSPMDWPQCVWVKQPELRALLAPFLAQRGIEVHLSPSLPALDDAKEGLIAFLQEGGELT